MALVARSCRNPCARHFHHMNPMTVADIVNGDEDILDLDNLITTTHNAHNAIQSGDESFCICLSNRGGQKTRSCGNQRKDKFMSLAVGTKGVDSLRRS